MVKGVNKTVIEINDTGSNFFEKVILFVTPQYSGMNTRRLKYEADKIICTYSCRATSVRQKYKRRRILACLAASVAAAGIITALILIFK